VAIDAALLAGRDACTRRLLKWSATIFAAVRVLACDAFERGRGNVRSIRSLLGWTSHGFLLLDVEQSLPVVAS
jgi:hypothetical protein